MKNKIYKIPFVGLKVGKHDYSFNINEEFFELFEYSPIQKGNLAVQLILDKTERHLHLTFQINGIVNLSCERCLGDLNLPIHTVEELYIVFKDRELNKGNDEVDIHYISNKTHEIDVSTYIYEMIVVNMPLVKKHPVDANGESNCDKEMEQVLRKLDYKNNKEKNNLIKDKLKKLKIM